MWDLDFIGKNNLDPDMRHVTVAGEGEKPNGENWRVGVTAKQFDKEYKDFINLHFLGPTSEVRNKNKFLHNYKKTLVLTWVFAPETKQL